MNLLRDLGWDATRRPARSSYDLRRNFVPCLRQDDCVVGENATDDATAKEMGLSPTAVANVADDKTNIRRALLLNMIVESFQPGETIDNKLQTTDSRTNSLD
mmetsp:Transcript_16675/g.35358  ORF Transcript_16675/g.35358 Transcript_16675/m.35358 type:complete len:102 (+) Transcript_16675:215-520(+)